MIITRNWLARYLEIGNYSDQALMLILNKIGIEIDHYQKIQHHNLQLALIKTAVKLEGTNHLNLCQVKTQNNKEFTVICGADNVQAGHYAIYAPEGAYLSSGLKLTAKKIQNVISFGMLCSLQELGFHVTLKQTGDNIFLIDPRHHPDVNLETAPDDIANAWGINDTIFAVNVLWDRPDYTSALRILAELSNFLQLKPKLPIPIFQNHPLKCKNTILSTATPLNGALLWITPSQTKWPWSWNDYFWSLHCGAYFNNNDFVNLTRYRLMLTTGLPLMAIPWSQNNALPSIALTNLNNNHDHQVWALINSKNQEPWLIFSGQNNCVPPQTRKQQKLLWITINFQEQAMRRQQKYFNSNDLIWERLIRPLPINYSIFIYDYMQKILNTSLPLIMKVNSASQGHAKVTLNVTNVNQTLGTDFAKNDLLKILKKITPCVDALSTGIVVTAPAWRSDLTRSIDWIAEIGRMFDFNNIKAQSLIIPPHALNTNDLYQMPQALMTQIHNFWSQHRFYEIINLNLINQEKAGHFNFYGYEQPLVINNPLSSEHAVLPQSLLPNLLEVLRYNSRNGFKNKGFYTIGQIHTPNKTYTHLAWALPQFTDKISASKTISGSFYTIKAYCCALIKDLGYNLHQLNFKPAPSDTWCHPYQSFLITANKKVIGVLGSLNLAFKQKNKLNQIYFGELNLEKLKTLTPIKNNIFKNWSRFQKTSRDVTIITSKKINFATVAQIMQQEPTIINVLAQDVYRDPNSSQQKITIRCEFNANNHQLNEGEINEAWNKILNQIRKFGVIDE